jgi:hypothetical protein
MMVTLRRRSPRIERTHEAGAETERPALAPGTVLGWFTQQHRIEVLVAGETRLWLRAWKKNQSGQELMVDVGPITWNEYRTPCLEPVPDWLNVGPLDALSIVFKSMALLAAVARAEPVDPALGLSVNPALGEFNHVPDPAVHRSA